MMPPTQDELIATLVGQIKDYRQGEIPSPDTDHVTRWIKQFDEARRVPVLAELTHVFQKTYFSKAKVEQFLNEVLTTKQLVGEDACAFWKATNFLNIQGGGNSQRDMLEMFDEVLDAKCSVSTQQCGSLEGPFIYLDDAVFTGNRIKRDLSDWIAGDAPQKTQVHVVTMAVHRGAQWYADNGVKKAAAAAGKSVDLTWWSALWVEDRKAYLTQSDVLRPVSLPDDEGTTAYVQMLKDAGYAPALRPKTALSKESIFSSPEARDLLEQEFLTGGVRVRQMAPYLPDNCRPLGYSVLRTLGFGSLIVTFRNCPNNCPLVFWAGDPWYPLFPRKTN